MQNSKLAVLSGCLLGCLLGCDADRAPQPEPATEPEITNRLHLPADVIANLGVTFAKAGRQRLGIWLAVPGRLEVPEDHRWIVRAPASGRATSILRLWATVEKGEMLAELVSPELLAIQQALLEAERAIERAPPNVAAGTARFTESEEHLAEARSVETGARARLEQLRELPPGTALSSKELLEAQRRYVEAKASVLDAALRRDELRSRVDDLEVRAAQAELAFRQHLRTLSVLTSIPEADLLETTNRSAAWKSLNSVALRAPGSGRIVALHVSDGERLAIGDPIVEVVDTSELVFRGQVPEGDLGEIPTDARVLVEPAAPGFAPIETRIAGSLPVANRRARTVRVEARVPNADRRLPDGFSAVARVLLAESEHEEIVLPEDCVVMDGLEAIVFKRDPDAPDWVVRTPVAVGRRARDAVEIFAGVMEGDEVVQQGALQLKETGLGKPPPGGHIHADGTWHGDHK